MSSHSITKAIAVSACAFIALTSYGEILTPEQALSRAMPSLRKAPGERLELAYTEKAVDAGTPAVYVFSNRQQFLVVSADDRADAVLGYADFAFDSGNIPPALKWWLGEYARQIEAAEIYGAAPAPLKTARETIAPLMTTRWDQSEPYNDLCPVFNNEKSMTGCVATAMAQVMNYHRWPVTGTGSNSYFQGIRRIQFDFGSTTFDWNNMLDSYNSADITDEQKTAVATLMFACGVSVNMRYASTASGASSVNIQKGLVNYLNYDKGVRWMSRDYYSLSQWEEIIYNQLVEYGPVLYSGVSNEGGHEFVCDGYNADGFYHFNWGWGGMSDGYFRLTALDPGQQGIGGSMSGFNYDQGIVANVSKPKEDSVVLPNLVLINNFNLPATGRIGNTISSDAQIMNYSYETASGKLGLRFINDETNDTTYTNGSRLGQGLQTSYYINGFDAVLPFKKSGTYTVTPAYCDDNGVWYHIPAKFNAVGSYKAKLEGSTFTFTAVSGGSMEIKDLELITQLYLGQKFKMKATAVNTGDKEYDTYVCPALINEAGNIVAFGDNLSVNIAVGETKTFEYLGSIANYPEGSSAPSKGNYKLCFINVDTQEPVSESIDVELKSGIAPRLAASDFALEGDSNDANAADLHFTATVRCNGGYFGGSLSVVIFPDKPDAYSIAIIPGNTLFLKLFEKGDFEAHGSIMHPEIGAKYIAAIYNDNTPISDYIEFTITKNVSGIEATAVPEFRAFPNPTDGVVYFSEKATEFSVYSLSGSLMLSGNNTDTIDISDLAPGMYILRAVPESDTSAPVVKRIIRK